MRLPLTFAVLTADPQLRVFGPGLSSRRTRKEPAAFLLRPVRAGTKRAAFVRHIGSNARSIKDVTTLLGMSRPAVVTCAHNLARVHGVGYVIDGDTIALQYPPGYSAYSVVR